MKKPIQVDPEKHRAIQLVLESVMFTLVMEGAGREEAIRGAAVLFTHAHREATLLELETALADSEG